MQLTGLAPATVISPWNWQAIGRALAVNGVNGISTAQRSLLNLLIAIAPVLKVLSRHGFIIKNFVNSHIPA
jgi:hypothetical protein